ncbi:hypothetical protein NC651_001467 [Populus alba x Populus x berolinensis]|nr:hypothetical protein NC651_001467 [Populus alba x Populus x berolinensis]
MRKKAVDNNWKRKPFFLFSLIFHFLAPVSHWDDNSICLDEGLALIL